MLSRRKWLIHLFLSLRTWVDNSTKKEKNSKFSKIPNSYYWKIGASYEYFRNECLDLGHCIKSQFNYCSTSHSEQEPLLGWCCGTVWNFDNFSAPQILRAINFWWLGDVKFNNLADYSPEELQKISKTWGQGFLRLPKW